MDEAGAREVGEDFQKLFHELHEKFRAQVRGLDHGTLNWRPLPKANSIAVLRVEADAAELLALADQADREVDEHMAGLTAEDLIQDRPRKDHDPKPGLMWLISNYGHAREHLAQVELTKQLYDSRT